MSDIHLWYDTIFNTIDYINTNYSKTTIIMIILYIIILAILTIYFFINRNIYLIEEYIDNRY